MQSLLASAIEFAQSHESSWSREVGQGWGIHQQDPPPWNRLFGPVHGRGPVSGLVSVAGKELARWGEPERADLTFSIAKTYLALLAGLAYDQGLIQDVQEPVGDRVKGIGFDDGANAQVTWQHLLQQTSEWEGSCLGIPEQVDRYRTVQLQRNAVSGKKGDPRPLSEPGSFWEYNDVRINQLSLALMHLFGRPLPEVFREYLMQPLGASDTWRWVGYDHAWVELRGRRMQTVPGGSHWGGGVSINCPDQMLLARLMLDQGLWQGKQLISQEWIQKMREPCALAPFYGYLLWLNTDGRVFPSIPRASYCAFGAGSSFVLTEPERELIVVVRWLNAEYADGFFARVLTALDSM